MLSAWNIYVKNDMSRKYSEGCKTDLQSSDILLFVLPFIFQKAVYLMIAIEF